MIESDRTKDDREHRDEETTNDDRTKDKMQRIEECTGDHESEGITTIRGTHWHDRRMIRRMK